MVTGPTFLTLKWKGAPVCMCLRGPIEVGNSVWPSEEQKEMKKSTKRVMNREEKSVRARQSLACGKEPLSGWRSEQQMRIFCIKGLEYLGDLVHCNVWHGCSKLGLTVVNVTNFHVHLNVEISIFSSTNIISVTSNIFPFILLLNILYQKSLLNVVRDVSTAAAKY